MRILVLGKNGMLGHVVYNYFKDSDVEVFGTVSHSSSNDELVYNAFDNMESFMEIVDTIRPNVVVNCIGILNSAAENDKVLAVKLNSLLPHYLDKVCRDNNIKFIHVSTDCVYEGTIGKYTEDSLPDARSFYGRSKALGEVINNQSVTLRTSIVGPDNAEKSIGLFKWFITQNNSVGGYTKVIWTGVTTIELAKVIRIAIDKNLTGLQHVVNNEFISKKDLLELFKKYFNKDIDIVENDSVISQKTLIRTDKSYPFEIPSYEEMIKEMRDWVLEHQDLYPLIYKNTNLR